MSGIKICGVCRNQKLYDDYHRSFTPCKICSAKKSVQ